MALPTMLHCEILDVTGVQLLCVDCVTLLLVAGVLAGALLLAGLSDVYGRLICVILSLVGAITFEGLSSFTNTYLTYLTLR